MVYGTAYPLAWNSNTSLSGQGLPNANASIGNYQNTPNPYGNYSSLGMGGIFDNVTSLCNLTDSITAQSADFIAGAQQQKSQTYAQGFYKAQQASALRDELRAQGIDPNSVLNQNQSQNGGISQLGSLLSLLGGTNSTTANTSTNQLGSLLSLLSGANSPTANTEISQLDQLAQAIGIAGTDGSTATAGTNGTNQIGAISKLFGSNTGINQIALLAQLLGSSGTTAVESEPPPSYDDEDGGDAAFWAYIDSKAAKSKQPAVQNNNSILIVLLLSLLTKGTSNSN